MPAAEHGFIEKTSPDGRCVLFVPKAYSGDRDWPVVLFLHGAGETGMDGIRPSKVGLGPAIEKRKDTFPFLVVFPQSWRGSWTSGEDPVRALAILDHVQTEYRVDAARVHLTGISMGGYGTWHLASKEPRRWASIVPVCGGGNPASSARIKHIPCWAFHGDADTVIAVERSREMVTALRAAGGSPRYTEFPNIGHSSWDPAYAMPELEQWWADQRRS